jgi:hypothetical protein
MNQIPQQQRQASVCSNQGYNSGIPQGKMMPQNVHFEPLERMQYMSPVQSPNYRTQGVFFQNPDSNNAQQQDYGQHQQGYNPIGNFQQGFTSKQQGFNHQTPNGNPQEFQQGFNEQEFNRNPQDFQQEFNRRPSPQQNFQQGYNQQIPPQQNTQQADMLPFLMHTLKLQEKQNEMAIDARLEKLKYLKDDNTFEEVKRFFIKFDALVKDKTDEEKMEQLELKVSGRAQFLFKNARKERKSYSFAKENILEMA